MNTLLKHFALVLLATASTAHATGNVHGSFFTRYHVDLSARRANGSPIHPTFTLPSGVGPVPYEAFTVAADAAGAGACWKVSAIRFSGTAEQKMWIEATPGNWVSLADDVVNVLDPGAYIYTESAQPTVIRIADYTAYVPTEQGQFFVTVTAQYNPSESRLMSCDRAATLDGWPYVRISASGAVTFVKRQGSP
ncbi:hypothetical protein [Pyxidicoccus trucidator]|uniref:hypothetical protein n=1 Tax=Pyxidicoccus trucidator TaxID=2709662 RepID=UPI0013DD0C3C|nr:hypothetical protein [Pyxidicoccus trucidator]